MLVFLKKILYGILVITPIIALVIITIIFPVVMMVLVIIFTIYAVGDVVDQELAERKKDKAHNNSKKFIPHG